MMPDPTQGMPFILAPYHPHLRLSSFPTSVTQGQGILEPGNRLGLGWRNFFPCWIHNFKGSNTIFHCRLFSKTLFLLLFHARYVISQFSTTYFNTPFCQTCSGKLAWPPRDHDQRQLLSNERTWMRSPPMMKNPLLKTTRIPKWKPPRPKKS